MKNSDFKFSFPKTFTLLTPIYRYVGWRIWYTSSINILFVLFFQFRLSILLRFPFSKMNDEILKNLMNCSLSECEADPVLLEETDLAEGVKECEASIYVKVLTLKDFSISVHGFTLAMQKAWHLPGLRMHRMGGQIFHVFFPSVQDKKKICDNGPWSFDNNLLMFKDWVRRVDPQQLTFNECDFNVQIRGLTCEFLTKEVALRIGNSFTNVTGVELRKEFGGQKFFRFKTTIRVDQPLRRIIKFRIGGTTVASFLAYERLPSLCFLCGLMGHLVRQCPSLPGGADPRQGHAYGLWIKAPMEKSGLIYHVEIGQSGQNSISGKLVEDNDDGESSRALITAKDKAPFCPPGFEGYATNQGFHSALKINDMFVSSGQLKSNIVVNPDSIQPGKVTAPLIESNNERIAGFEEVETQIHKEFFQETNIKSSTRGSFQDTLNFFDFTKVNDNDGCVNGNDQCSSNTTARRMGKAKYVVNKKRSHPYLKGELDDTSSSTKKKAFVSDFGLGVPTDDAFQARADTQPGQSP